MIKEIPSGLREEELSEAHLFEFLEKPEAEVPVPDRLLPKWRSKQLWDRLKLSQQIGCLLFLNRKGDLSKGGAERLLYLQAKASFEAIEAGMRFARRLSEEKKLQSDFRHQLTEANRRPQSKRYRRREVRRIGVGYRDKGTLPEVSSRARREAEESCFIFSEDLPENLRNILFRLFPTAVEGEWFDLSVLAELDSDQDRRISPFLHLL